MLLSIVCVKPLGVVEDSMARARRKAAPHHHPRLGVIQQRQEARLRGAYHLLFAARIESSDTERAAKGPSASSRKPLREARPSAPVEHPVDLVYWA